MCNSEEDTWVSSNTCFFILLNLLTAPSAAKKAPNSYPSSSSRHLCFTFICLTMKVGRTFVPKGLFFNSQIYFSSFFHHICSWSRLACDSSPWRTLPSIYSSTEPWQHRTHNIPTIILMSSLQDGKIKSKTTVNWMIVRFINRHFCVLRDGFRVHNDRCYYIWVLHIFVSSCLIHRWNFSMYHVFIWLYWTDRHECASVWSEWHFSLISIFLTTASVIAHTDLCCRYRAITSLHQNQKKKQISGFQTNVPSRIEQILKIKPTL